MFPSLVTFTPMSALRAQPPTEKFFSFAFVKTLELYLWPPL